MCRNIVQVAIRNHANLLIQGIVLRLHNAELGKPVQDLLVYVDQPVLSEFLVSATYFDCLGETVLDILTEINSVYWISKGKQSSPLILG